MYTTEQQKELSEKIAKEDKKLFEKTRPISKEIRILENKRRRIFRQYDKKIKKICSEYQSQS